MLDERDLQILSILQSDARTSNAEIGRRLGIAPSAILERIRKLERRGVISGYSARIDPRAVGRGLLAYVFVQAGEGPGGSTLGRRLAELPEVMEVHHVAGEDCYLIKIRCSSPEELGLTLRERLGQLPDVLRTRSTVVLGTVKESLELDLSSVSGGGE
jgi:Lrp/AsnC family leucine-responsive transcriptional regulator